MSGLSAKTSSCGGDGSRFGLGGDGGGGGKAFLVAFFAFIKIGASFCTSSSGAEDSALLSESSIIGMCRCDGGVGDALSREVRVVRGR